MPEGGREALIVSHRIPLRGAEAGAVAEALKSLAGVLQVSTDAGGRHVLVSYDLGHLRCDGIEAVIDHAGGRPARGLAAALRRHWRRFTEGNILDSVNRRYSSCCNRPPK